MKKILWKVVKFPLLAIAGSLIALTVGIWLDKTGLVGVIALIILLAFFSPE